MLPEYVGIPSLRDPHSDANDIDWAWKMLANGFAIPNKYFIYCFFFPQYM